MYFIIAKTHQREHFHWHTLGCLLAIVCFIVSRLQVLDNFTVTLVSLTLDTICDYKITNHILSYLRRDVFSFF